MPENEIEQDARIAGRIGTPRAEAALAAMRTPRWIGTWIVPVAGIILLIQARQILGPFVIAGVIAYIFSMMVDSLQERLHWPRGLLVAVLYLGVLAVLGTGIYFGAAQLIEQTRALVNQGPDIVETVLRRFMGDTGVNLGGQSMDTHTLARRVNDSLSGYFGSGGDALHLVSEVVGRLLDTILVIMVSFYLLLDGKRVEAYLLKFVPARSRARTGYIAGRINTVLGAYLRGQLLLILIMSTASFILLQFVFQVPYALPIAILTGFFEILPLIGPAIATAIAASVALATPGLGLGTAVWVVVAYLILRQVEDQLVMPFVVGRSVELHPVATIFAVLAGGAIAGAIGMLLAVPAAAAIKVILDFMYPPNSEVALAEAMPGIEKAEREAEARGEEHGHGAHSEEHNPGAAARHNTT